MMHQRRGLGREDAEEAKEDGGEKRRKIAWIRREAVGRCRETLRSRGRYRGAACECRLYGSQRDGTLSESFFGRASVKILFVLRLH